MLVYVHAGNRQVEEDWEVVGIANEFPSDMRLQKFGMQGSCSASAKDQG